LVIIPENIENKIAGVVVLYNPDKECIKNINSYLDQVNFLYLVDNSKIQNTELCNKLILSSKVKYIANEMNLGIAHALNQAVVLAKQDNFSFLLMMDQDSSADSELIRYYADYLSSNDISKLGILSPVVVYLPEIINTDSTSIKEIEVAITSGCLLNLNASQKSGPFDEKLFIDYVDFEYCLRLRKMGFSIIQIGKAKIYHQLGNLEKRDFLFKTIYVTHHLPTRYYYRTRNRLYVDKKYISSFPLFVLKDFFVFLNELLKIIFFEEKKSLKIKLILYGFYDFLLSKYGKFENIHSSFLV
jgi:rhamnosyltransferase